MVTDSILPVRYQKMSVQFQSVNYDLSTFYANSVKNCKTIV